ncbi:LOW QUALITY PROTEIN: hypothetical protein YC2023_034297 [Brassica napus]
MLPQKIGHLTFDKYDQLAIEFFIAPANIVLWNSSVQSFKAKGIAGSIVHAVAKTNAIVAGLIVIEAIKVLKKDVDNHIYASLCLINNFISNVYMQLTSTLLDKLKRPQAQIKSTVD